LVVETPGAYAFHLVGMPTASSGLSDDHRLVATTCHDVDGPVTERGVVLAVLEPSDDLDGDTFPDDLDEWCAVRAANGIPCDLRCDEARWAAARDCNPPADAEVPAGCPAPPPDAEVNPFVVDRCGDCWDQDCFEGDAACVDADGDGHPAGRDCADDDPAIHPGAVERCGDAVDDNCAVDLPGCVDGDVPCDGDGDGFLAVAEAGVLGCGDDCDDGDAAVHPGAHEGCGADPSAPATCPGCPPAEPAGVDDDCDGRADEGCFGDDLDLDGTPAAVDCDDCDSSIAPGARDECGDELDQDCDGRVVACGADDHDGDGFDGPPASDDCDDGDAHVYPGAAERCGDGVAQGCARDVPCAEVVDRDGDGFGAGNGDCDDGDPRVNPWAVEVCDAAGVDEDCDGAVNEGRDPTARCVRDAAAGAWVEVDLETDMDHCGACREQCCQGTCECRGDACAGGRCVCHGAAACTGGAASYCCPDGCRDLGSDPESCGACGERCLEGEVCEPSGPCGLGRCTCAGGAPCPREEGWRCCPGSGCANLWTDPVNCGECANDCTASERPEGDGCGLVWWSGARRCVCGPSESICLFNAWCTEVTEPPGESCGCADLAADARNCGQCRHACGPNEACRSGECRCGESGRACGGTIRDTCCPPTGCVDLLTNTANCGACGTVCPSRCVFGTCV
jgi:hypothetical protein